MTDKQRKRLENMDTLLYTEGEHMENSTAWIIQDFSNLLETKKVGERIESPIYRVYQCHALASPAILFKIVCFPSGVTEENRGYVSMKIETCEMGTASPGSFHTKSWQCVQASFSRKIS